MTRGATDTTLCSRLLCAAWLAAGAGQRQPRLGRRQAAGAEAISALQNSNAVTPGNRPKREAAGLLCMATNTTHRERSPVLAKQGATAAQRDVGTVRARLCACPALKTGPSANRSRLSTGPPPPIGTSRAKGRAGNSTPALAPVGGLGVG